MWKTIHGKRVFVKESSHGIHRQTPAEFRDEQMRTSDTTKKALEAMRNEKQRKEQDAKDERYRKYGGLAERTDRYIAQGDSEDDAFQQATEDLGMHYDYKTKRYR